MYPVTGERSRGGGSPLHDTCPLFSMVGDTYRDAVNSGVLNTEGMVSNRLKRLQEYHKAGDADEAAQEQPEITK